MMWWICASRKGGRGLNAKKSQGVPTRGLFRHVLPVFSFLFIFFSLFLFASSSSPPPFSRPLLFQRYSYHSTCVLLPLLLCRHAGCFSRPVLHTRTYTRQTPKRKKRAKQKKNETRREKRERVKKKKKKSRKELWVEASRRCFRACNP